MTLYSRQAAQAACDQLGMKHDKTYLDTCLLGTPVKVYRHGLFVHLELPSDSDLILYEEVDIDTVILALNEAKEDRNEIQDKIEEEIKLHKEKPLPPEPDCWNPWPDSAPPDGEMCFVTFRDNGREKMLIGTYHEEFSLWAFPTLDGRVQTFTASDRNISSVNYRPLKL